MGLVSPSQSADGQTIEADDINGPINQLAAEINGNLDDNNIASVSGSKITDETVTTAKIADGAVTTDTLAESAVTPDKLATGAGSSWVWQNYTPTLSGFSGSPTITYAKWRRIGKQVEIFISVTGTSNATTKFFTLPSGQTPAAWTDGQFLGVVRTADASDFLGATIMRTTTPNVQVYKGLQGGSGTPFSGWTSSGTASYGGTIVYEVA